MIENRLIHIDLPSVVQPSKTLAFLPNIDGPLEWTAIIILIIILIVLRREIKSW